MPTAKRKSRQAQKLRFYIHKTPLRSRYRRRKVALFRCLPLSPGFTQQVDFALVNQMENKFAEQRILPSKPRPRVSFGVVFVERLVHKPRAGIGAHQHLKATLNLRRKNNALAKTSSQEPRLRVLYFGDNSPFPVLNLCYFLRFLHICRFFNTFFNESYYICSCKIHSEIE